MYKQKYLSKYTVYVNTYVHVRTKQRISTERPLTTDKRANFNRTSINN